MESAKFDRNTITIISDNNDTVCKASGSVLKFDGFLKIYNNPSKDDDESILMIRMNSQKTNSSGKIMIKMV